MELCVFYRRLNSFSFLSLVNYRVFFFFIYSRQTPLQAAGMSSSREYTHSRHTHVYYTQLEDLEVLTRFTTDREHMHLN